VVRCLNLGCGSRYVQGWANLDFVATKDVIGHDLRKPLPFADGEFDIVYHSHVLEHFRKVDATRFLRECWRVLKPGGLCRIAVPDLEGIATFYLREVDSLRRGGGSRSSNHEWMLLELYDQVVRTEPGGAMVEFLERETLENEDFVTTRLGIEAKRIIERSRRQRVDRSVVKNTRLGIKSGIKRLAQRWRMAGAAMLAGIPVAALHAAKFRETGENHLCMYDEFALRNILSETEFVDMQRQDAKSSAISEWAAFALDTEPDGTTYKPDSLFMEARRPQRTASG
jgi:predicted SAM-dependent methyltransferase